MRILEPSVRLLVVIGVAGVVAVGCGNGAESDLTANLEYVPGRELDVHYPTQPGPWPVLVLIHGAGLGRESYNSFARLLAESGAVVFNADWRVLADHVEDSLGDIACAVRYARSQADEYGGDPGRTMLIGHSTGAVYAGEVASNGDAYAGDCAMNTSALTQGLALLAPAQVPGGRPWSHRTLGSNPELRVVIVHGQSDDVARPSLSIRTMGLLEDAGYDVAMTLVDGDHYQLVLAGPAQEDPDDIGPDHPARVTAATIMDLARSLGRQN
jgi:predicted esterase